jgi:hypothetical protein
MPTPDAAVEGGLFADCAFPADCECRKRGYEHEAEDCLVPTIVQAFARVNFPAAAALFGGKTPDVTVQQRAEGRMAAWAVTVLSDIANADLYRDHPHATTYLDDFQPLVRIIGENLWDLGGRALMAKVHGVIAERYPRPGANLDRAWNGVGDWTP